MEVYVDYVIFSLGAHNKHGINNLLGFTIESPITNIGLVSIPGEFTFNVSIMLNGISDSESCEMIFLINTPGGDRYPIPIPVHPNSPDVENNPNKLATRFVSFKLKDYKFREEGIFTYEVFIDGDFKKDGEFGVYLIPGGVKHG